MATVQAEPVGRREPSNTRRSTPLLPPAVTRILIVAASLGVWEIASQAGAIDPFTAPAPSEIFGAMVDTAQTADFYANLERTMWAILVAFALGMAAGIPLGFLMWRVRVLGVALEPFLVTMYAVPTLVFYPILIAIMGLGAAPIITIASVFAFVPITINTLISLRSINPTLLRLSDSLCMSKRQATTKVIGPAVTPLIFPGIKLGFIYAMVATIAMEFLLATQGLGFAIGLKYREFKSVDMWVYLMVVILFSSAVNILLTAIERRIRKDMLL